MHSGTAELEREQLALAKADRDIAAGEDRIRDQVALADRLREKGEDSARAERLLDLLRETLAAWETHRELIVARIAELEARREPG